MADRCNLATPWIDKDGKPHWHRIGVAFPKKGKDGWILKFNSMPIPRLDDNGQVEVVVGMFEDTGEGDRNSGN